MNAIYVVFKQTKISPRAPKVLSYLPIFKETVSAAYIQNCQKSVKVTGK